MISKHSSDCINPTENWPNICRLQVRFHGKTGWVFVDPGHPACPLLRKEMFTEASTDMPNQDARFVACTAELHRQPPARARDITESAPHLHVTCLGTSSETSTSGAVCILSTKTEKNKQKRTCPYLPNLHLDLPDLDLPASPTRKQEQRRKTQKQKQTTFTLTFRTSTFQQTQENRGRGRKTERICQSR